MAALHFNVEHIIYAADRTTADAYGFDYARSYSLFSTDRSKSRTLPWRGTKCRSRSL